MEIQRQDDEWEVGGDDSSAGSQWSAGPGADGSSAGGQWSAGPGTHGASAGSQWTAGREAAGTDDGTTDGGIDVDKWLSDPIGQLEQLGEDVAPFIGTGQPLNVQDGGGGGDTGAADTPSVTDILADPSGALERAISVVQQAISGYGAKESEEGGLSSTEQGYVAALQTAVGQLSTLRGSDDASSIAVAVGPILGVAHYLEGGGSAPPASREPADGATVQRTAAIGILGGAPVAVAPIIIAGVVIIAIVLIGRWLVTRSDPPRVPAELLNDFALANAALREALAILGATTAASITVEQFENVKKFVNEAEEKLNEILNDAFVKGLTVAGRCLNEILRLSSLLNIVKDILSRPLDDIDFDELRNFILDILGAISALNSCIQGIPPDGGEKKAA